MLVALALPVTWERGEDGFPRSSYPMFAEARGREASIPTVVGVHADGRRHPLDPETIGATRWPNLAARRVLDATREGTADELCREVATRVRDDQTVALEVVTETFDTLDYFVFSWPSGPTPPRDAGQSPAALFTAGPLPLRRQVHTRCAVAR